MKNEPFYPSFLVFGLLLLTGCQVEPALATAGTSTAPAISQEVVPQMEHSGGPSCGRPTPALLPDCVRRAGHILAATARLELAVTVAGQDGRDATEILVGHGTVKGGRYLVTHNHFGLSPEELTNSRLRYVSVYHANGTMALKKLPFGTFTVITSGPETLLFDFGEYDGQGLLAVVGLASAEFDPVVPVQSGVEVAQIDWDGATAHVDWVRVTAVHPNGDTPYLELDNFVQHGASGGGIFYEGVHIANNWYRSTDHAAYTGEVLRQYSVAALNE